eukprot:1874709-Alexandrium_andersonii.AAC.1
MVSTKRFVPVVAILRGREQTGSGVREGREGGSRRALECGRVGGATSDYGAQCARPGAGRVPSEAPRGRRA